MARICCLTLWFSVFLSALLYAQDPETATPPPDAAISEDATLPPPVYPTMDVGDLWHQLRHQAPPPDHSPSDDARRFLVIAPMLGSRPSTGLTLGISTNVAFLRGDANTTHVSTMSGSVRVSQQKQVLSSFRHAVFTADDRWFLQGDNRLNSTSLTTYALGIDSPPESAANLEYNFARLSETVYRNLGKNFFVGAGLMISAHTDVQPKNLTTSNPAWLNSAYVAYSNAHGFALTDQNSSGTAFALLYDSRGNSINAQRGWLASASYRTYFNGFLSGDSTWQELVLDTRHYVRLSKDGRRRLAFWAMGDFVTGGTAPYFDLPSTSSDGRSARGYTEGRYRGDHLVYSEVEYRGDLTRTGLIGMVAFLNTTTIGDSTTDQHLFNAWAPGEGLGLRVLLNKRSRTNLAADYGWGKSDSTGFYMGIQEAF
ncbi:MAG: hypothetical protein LBQ09_08870 [Acidobacteriaceae bacterium]|jgi:outer membrane protein assembly factor BamA|nr:hypothetical protein [Acidobacteriaceae bacterium]